MEAPVSRLTRLFTQLISETNGLALEDTLVLAEQSPHLDDDPELRRLVGEFHALLGRFRLRAIPIDELIAHPVSHSLEAFFRRFPLPFREEHIHLTGSLAADFIYPRLAPLLEGEHGPLYAQKIAAVYGPDSLPIRNASDVDRLIRLRDEERFDRYLKILYLPKLILTSREAHRDAAYHMASRLYRTANVGALRLKFTLFRETTDPSEQIPGLGELTAEDVVMGLYEGFRSFQREMPEFRFILSPSFRKEAFFFDSSRFSSKHDDFIHQIKALLALLEKYPFLREKVTDVDTVGDEREHYRKRHFEEMRLGFRKLQFRGFHIRSHHGETWKSLRRGVQAVDNAMNIWHVDAIEHGRRLTRQLAHRQPERSAVDQCSMLFGPNLEPDGDRLSFPLTTGHRIEDRGTPRGGGLPWGHGRPNAYRRAGGRELRACRRRRRAA